MSPVFMRVPRDCPIISGISYCIAQLLCLDVRPFIYIKEFKPGRPYIGRAGLPGLDLCTWFIDPAKLAPVFVFVFLCTFLGLAFLPV